MDVLKLFTIDGVLAADRTQLTTAFLPVKTWNLERFEARMRPGTPVAGNEDNLDIAGPDSAFDHYV